MEYPHGYGLHGIGIIFESQKIGGFLQGKMEQPGGNPQGITPHGSEQGYPQTDSVGEPHGIPQVCEDGKHGVELPQEFVPQGISQGLEKHGDEPQELGKHGSCPQGP